LTTHDDGHRAITIAHPEHCSGELKISGLNKNLNWTYSK
jgi:hypothetical protein